MPSVKEQLWEVVDNLSAAFNIDEQDYTEYQGKPLEFCREVLNIEFIPVIQEFIKDVDKNRIVVGQSCTGVGKTHALGALSTYYYKCYPDSKVITLAAPPESNLDKLLWGEIRKVIFNNQGVFRNDQLLTKELRPLKDNKTKGELPHYITGVTIPATGTAEEKEGRFSGKHAPVLIFFVDEANAVPMPVFKGIYGCMTGGKVVKLVMLLNPRRKVGEAFKLGEKGRAKVKILSAFDHPNVVTGADVIPGAVTRESTLEKINEWTRPLAPGENFEPGTCFTVPDFLVGATCERSSGGEYPPLPAGGRIITEPAFSYVVLGLYPAQGTKQLISEEWITAARSRWDAYVAMHGEIPPKHTKGIMGQDVGEYGTDPSVSCFRYGGYVERHVRWTSVDVIVTGVRAATEYKKRDLLRANVDRIGLGSGVAPHMQTLGCNGISVDVTNVPTEECKVNGVSYGKFHSLREQLIWKVREWLRSGEAMLPPEELLIEELLFLEYWHDDKKGEVRITGNKVLKSDLHRSGDDLTALFLTFADQGLFRNADLR